MKSRQLERFRRSVYSSSRWQKIREIVLSGNGAFCEECGVYATDVDHIIPLSKIYESGELELAYAIENLRPLCKRCHGKKSLQEGIGKKRK